MKARASVTGLGVWFPETIRKNDAWPSDFGKTTVRTGDRTLVDIPRGLDDAGEISLSYLASEQHDPFLGAVERRVADASMSAVEAQVLAAQAALADAGLAAHQLDFVISYDIVPDRVSPAAACRMIDLLGATRAVGFAVDAACAAGVTQIAIARGLVESGQARHVLVSQSHLLTRAFPMSHPASPGIGDGATAFVVSAEPRWPILHVIGHTHGEYYDAVTWCRGESAASDPPWWKAGPDYRLGSYDPAGTKRLMRDTVAFGAVTVRELMASADRDLRDVRLLASVHPRGWTPLAIARCLGLAEERVECVYRDRAHLGGSGPFANWARARGTGALEPGGLVAIYAQGAGFLRMAALIEVPPRT